MNIIKRFIGFFILAVIMSSVFSFFSQIDNKAFALEQMPDTVGYSELHIYDWGDEIPSGASALSSRFTVLDETNVSYKTLSPEAAHGYNDDVGNFVGFLITSNDSKVAVRWDHIGYYINELGQRVEVGCTLRVTDFKLKPNSYSKSHAINTWGNEYVMEINERFYESEYYASHDWLYGLAGTFSFSFFECGNPNTKIDFDRVYVTGTSLDYNEGWGGEYVAASNGWTGEAFVPDLTTTYIKQGTYDGYANCFYNSGGGISESHESKANKVRATMGFSGTDINLVFGSMTGSYGFQWEFSALKSLSITCAPTIKKTVDGNTPPSDHLFTFAVKGVTHSSFSKSVTTNSSGTLNLGNLETYTDRGEFIYQLTETTRAGYAAHDPVYLKVKVSANNGKLVSTYAFYSDAACSASKVLTTIDNHKLTKGISLTKTSNPVKISGDSAVPGSTITYSFNITNTGEADLSNVSISDELQGLSSITYNWTNGNGVLKAGKTVTATATYSIKQSDIDRGSVTNTATASGVTVLNETATSKEATVTTAIEQQPSISLDKNADNSVLEDAHAGSSIGYTFIIRNTGNVTLHGISLNDPLLGGQISISKTTLAPNESTTATSTYKIIQQDIENGNVNNTASVSGISPSDASVSSNDSYEVKIVQKPSVEFDKSVNKEDISNASAGDEIVYTFTVHNTGNTTLSDLNVNDDMLGGNITSNMNKITLQPGESSVGTMRYVIEQSDIDAGSIENEADITMVSRCNSQTLKAADAAITNIERTSSISFEKSADRDHLSMATDGDLVNYSFIVINTGNTTIKNGSISDPLLGTLTLNKTTLTPGEVATASKQYSITQDDIDAGARDNTATTQWTSADGSNISKQSSWNIGIDRTPSISLDKSVIGNIVISNASASDTVQFRLTIANTGNTTLTDVRLNDELDGAIIDTAGMKTTLLPGESTQAIATYALKQSDIDAGDVMNVAVADARTPNGCEPSTVTSRDDANVEITRQPSVFLDKTAQPQQIEDALPGDVVTYTFTIENNGNTTLSDLKLTDPMLGGDIQLDNTVIQPGESVQAKAEYRLTQSDIDKGSVHNEATVVSTAPQGSAIANPSSTDTADVTIAKTPLLELSKNIVYDSENSDELEDHEVGDTISFELVIMNTGNTTLTDIHLDDEMLGGNIDLANAEKAIDTSMLTGEQVDADNTSDGDLQNESDVTDENAMSNAQEATEEAADSAENSAMEHPYISEHAELDESLPTTTLLPGEYLRIVLPYTITQSDIDNGAINNVANAFALPPVDQNGKQEELSATGEAGMPLPSTPSIDIVKTADTDLITNAQPGNVITYTMTITNNGDVSLKDISLTDELDGIKIDTSELDGIDMQPGDSKTITATYAITQDDIDNGYVDNHAVVTAKSVSDCISDSSAETIRENNGTVQDDDTVSVKIEAPAVERESGVMDILLAQTGDDFRNGFIAVISVVTIASGVAMMLYRKRANK